MHYCEVCGRDSTEHSCVDLMDDNSTFLLPPCCKGCGCGSFEEAYPNWDEENEEI